MSLIFGLRPALTVLLIKITVLSSIGYINTVEAAVSTFLVPIRSTTPRSVSEDEAPGTSILTLEGQDTDGDTLTFSVVAQVPNIPPFELESVSGLLTVPSGLDAEQALQYEFVFGIRDGSTTTNSVSYKLNIVDVNDNIPRFTSRVYEASVHASDNVGTEILKVAATDGDITAPNNEMTFSISGNAYFAISSEGSITLNSKLDSSSTTTYNLTVTVTDTGLSTTASLIITVNKSCTAGLYGENCRYECGNCSNGEPCDPMTGICENGCAVGYQTSFCNTECNRGTYGLGCSLTCGNCRGNYLCLFTDGTCPNGCAAGYHGEDCKAECIIGTYGEGCTKRCGVCVNWTACNNTNGACVACEPGFFGAECKSTERMEVSATNESLLLIISGWIFGGVALLAAVGIIICMKIRTRTKQQPPQNDTGLYAIPTNSRNEEEHQYETPSGHA